MPLTSASSIYKRVGPGKIYIVPAPTTGITTEEDYYKLFFGATGTAAAAKKVLTSGVNPWATLDKSGLDLKMKPSTVTFDPNSDTKSKVITGIDEAEADFTFYDIDPPHLVDIFGSQAADLIAVAAATGVAARNIALLGPQSYNIPYTVLYRFASMVVPGEFVHWLFTNVLFIPEIDTKMSKADEMKIKLTLELQCSPFLMNSAGNGVIVITDDPTAPGL